jgi:hypothetical protein
LLVAFAKGKNFPLVHNKDEMNNVDRIEARLDSVVREAQQVAEVVNERVFRAQIQMLYKEMNGQFYKIQSQLDGLAQRYAADAGSHIAKLNEQRIDDHLAESEQVARDAHSAHARHLSEHADTTAAQIRAIEARVQTFEARAQQEYENVQAQVNVLNERISELVHAVDQRIVALEALVKTNAQVAADATANLNNHTASEIHTSRVFVADEVHKIAETVAATRVELSNLRNEHSRAIEALAVNRLDMPLDDAENEEHTEAPPTVVENEVPVVAQNDDGESFAEMNKTAHEARASAHRASWMSDIGLAVESATHDPDMLWSQAARKFDQASEDMFPNRTVADVVGQIMSDVKADVTSDARVFNWIRAHTHCSSWAAYFSTLFVCLYAAPLVRDIGHSKVANLVSAFEDKAAPHDLPLSPRKAVQLATELGPDAAADVAPDTEHSDSAAVVDAPAEAQPPVEPLLEHP